MKYLVHYFVTVPTGAIYSKEMEIMDKREMVVQAKSPRAALAKVEAKSNYGFFNRAFKAEVIT
jgi:hypothetical protein